MRTNNIKNIRQRLGLSQSELAEAVSVSQGNISHYEKQRQEVSLAVARRLILFAKERGIYLSFNDIYATEQAGNGFQNYETSRKTDR